LFGTLSETSTVFVIAKMLRGKYLLSRLTIIRSTWDISQIKYQFLTAFIEELHHINKMCLLMGKPALFKEEYGGR